MQVLWERGVAAKQRRVASSEKLSQMGTFADRKILYASHLKSTVCRGLVHAMWLDLWTILCSLEGRGDQCPFMDKRTEAQSRWGVLSLGMEQVVRCRTRMQVSRPTEIVSPFPQTGFGVGGWHPLGSVTSSLLHFLTATSSDSHLL